MEQTLSAPSNPPRPSRRWLFIALVVILAGLVRLWAAWQLPPDADEPVYLKAGQAYAGLIKGGDWQGVIDYEGNREHPALVKLVYAVPYLIYEPAFGSTAERTFNRVVSVVFGTLAVLVLALIDPLAGLFLAMDSMVIKYTSEVYLESIPLFASLLAVFALRRALRSAGKNGWFWLSAVAIGAAGAGKYLYLLAGIPLLVMFFWQRKPRWVDLLLYLGAAGLAFWAFNPSLWADPFNRLWQSLTFHASYTGGSDVLRANYPWYQVVNWITAPVPWHANVFFFPTTDVLIFFLLFFGLLREARQRPWALAWMAAAFLALLVWPTKWPQYTLVLIPAMSLVASTGVRVIVDRFKEFEATWHWGEAVLPRPGKLFYVSLVIFLVVLLTGKLWYEFDMAAARKGWTQVLAEFTPLTSNSVNDIAPSPDGQMVMATNQGVVFWKPDARSPWGDSEAYYQPDNSGLAHAVVRCLLRDRSGNWWFGTQAGLSVLTRDGAWKTYHAADLGLESDEILALAEDNDGRIWLGSKSGAAHLIPGQSWQALTPQNDGLPAGPVFAIAVQPTAIWFATQNGVTAYFLSPQKWQTFDLSSYGLGWMGVSDLFVDRDGILWVATLGDGISKTDGETWITFRTSNSKIPGNAVTRILQNSSGEYWFGMAYSTEPGGFVARFDGTEWRSFSPQNSGYSGGEPVALAFDAENRLWIGTRVDGVTIYQPQVEK